MSDPLPQSFVGSSWHWTALNLHSETLSRVPYDEQGTPAHLGLDQKKKKNCGSITFLATPPACNFSYREPLTFIFLSAMVLHNHAVFVVIPPDKQT